MSDDFPPEEDWAGAARTVPPKAGAPVDGHESPQAEERPRGKERGEGGIKWMRVLGRRECLSPGKGSVAQVSLLMRLTAYTFSFHKNK